MNFMVNSCKRSTFLIEKRSLEGLDLREKMLLKVHLSMCKTCHAYQTQSKLIDRFVEKVLDQKYKRVTLSEAFKNHLIDQLK